MMCAKTKAANLLHFKINLQFGHGLVALRKYLISFRVQYQYIKMIYNCNSKLSPCTCLYLKKKKKMVF